MAIASLLIDYDHMQDYTQESDEEIMEGFYTEVMSMESASRDLDELDHARAGLENIHLSLESTDTLDEQANRYLGLAMDAVLGRPQTIQIGDRQLRTHENVFTLESDDKKGLGRRIWEMVQRIWAQMKVAARKLMESAANMMKKLFDGKNRVDKKLKEVKDAVSNYTPPEGEYVLQANYNTRIGTKEAKNFDVVAKRMANLNKFGELAISTVIKSFSTATDAMLNEKDVDPDSLKDIGVAAANIDGLKKFKQPLPGDQQPMFQKFSETTLGEKLAKVPGLGNMVDNRQVLVTGFEGERPSGTLTFKKAPTAKEMDKFLGTLDDLSKSIDQLRGLNNTMDQSMANIRRSKLNEKDVVEGSEDAVAVLQARKAIATSPLYKFPPMLARELYTTYATAVKFAEQVVSSSKKD